MTPVIAEDQRCQDGRINDKADSADTGKRKKTGRKFIQQRTTNFDQSRRDDSNIRLKPYRMASPRSLLFAYVSS